MRQVGSAASATGNVADFAEVLRRDPDHAGRVAAPGKVVAFARPGAAPARLLRVDVDDRPAPPPRATARCLLLLVASILLHGALLVWAEQSSPPPRASVGEVSVAVEVVLGSQIAAGQASMPQTAEAQSAPPPAPAEPATAEPDPPSPPEPVQTAASVDAAVSPDGDQAVTPAKPRKIRPTTTPKTERRRAEPKPSAMATRAAPPTNAVAADPSSSSEAASSGVGIGRSDVFANYRGLVAAHLARHKQFPAEAAARREQGDSMVTFTIDEAGAVIAVRLVRGSGSDSLDRETEAMVRRASPFPAPPDMRTKTFTVPVSFHLR